jgi:hypothetical protein
MQFTWRSLLFYPVLSFAFALTFVSAQAQTSELANKRKKLTINDYKGIPDESSNFLARTNPVLSFEYSNPVSCIPKDRIKFTVSTQVSVGSKSWMKITEIRKPEILNELLSHEQGHYDISEIFSIDLQKKLSSLCFDKARYKTEIDSVFRSMSRYYDSLQQKYDGDTGYMLNRESQTKWKQKISAMYRKVTTVAYEAR